MCPYEPNELRDEIPQTSSDVELSRVAEILMEVRDDLRDWATASYQRQGRGAVVFSEQSSTTHSSVVTPFYMPANDPALDRAGMDVQDAVDVYDPTSECVVLFLSNAGRSFVFLLELSSTAAPTSAHRYN